METLFYKYEGAGNDFVILDNRTGRFDPRPGLVAALCDRHTGIGADGMMLLEDDSSAQFRMRYFNSDGPEATMCGNGGRCMALFAEHLGIGGRIKRFAAADGTHEAAVESVNGETGIISLGMSDVSGITSYGNGWLLDTGSPHYVEFTDSLADRDVFALGRAKRYEPGLAEKGGANINFVELQGKGRLAMRTYERGVEDETRACGTGAVAAAITAAAVLSDGADTYTVTVPGGTLTVAFRKESSGLFTKVRLTGPARRVFSGIFKSDNFIGSRRRLEKNI